MQVQLRVTLGEEAGSVFYQLISESDVAEGVSEFLRTNNREGKSLGYLTAYGEKKCVVSYKDSPSLYKSRGKNNVVKVILLVCIGCGVLLIGVISLYVSLQVKRSLSREGFAELRVVSVRWCVCFESFV